MAPADAQLCEELWGEVYGLNPATFAAWRCSGEPRKPTYRPLKDGSGWVVEGPNDLELGRYKSEEAARVTLLSLKTLFSWLRPDC